MTDPGHFTDPKWAAQEALRQSLLLALQGEKEMTEEECRREIRRNREGATAFGIILLGIVGLTVTLSLVVWGLRSLGLNADSVYLIILLVCLLGFGAMLR